MPRDRPDTNTPYIPRDRAAEASARAARKVAKLAEHKAMLTAIALEHCGVETLETRNNDRLDFHDVSAEGLHRALETAYAAGLKAGSR